MKVKIFLAAIILLILMGVSIAAADQAEVYIIRVADAISPGTADFIKSGIKKAEENRPSVSSLNWIHPVGWRSRCALSFRVYWQAGCRSWYSCPPVVPEPHPPG